MSDERHPDHDRFAIEALIYVVELWTPDEAEVELVLARTQTLTLAQAAFSASTAEYPERMIRLRRGATVISERRFSGTAENRN